MDNCIKNDLNLVVLLVLAEEREVFAQNQKTKKKEVLMSPNVGHIRNGRFLFVF